MKWFVDNLVIESEHSLEFHEMLRVKERYRLFGITESTLPCKCRYTVRKWDDMHGGYQPQPNNGPMPAPKDPGPADAEPIKDDGVKCAPPGVWMCFHWGRSSCVPFATEIEALRYACENKTEVKYVEYGHEVIRG